MHPPYSELFIGLPGNTGRDTADRFAEQSFDLPRQVAEWNGNRFRLVDGVKWYQVDSYGKLWAIYAAESSAGQ